MVRAHRIQVETRTGVARSHRAAELGRRPVRILFSGSGQPDRQRRIRGAVHAVATESDSGGNHAYRLLLLRVVFQQERIASMESHRRVLLSGTGRLFYFQAVDGRRNDPKSPDVRSGLFAVRLPDEIRPDGLLRFRKRDLARLDIFQQPRHVVAQRAHGLHTFGILRRFAGQPAVYAVPVLRRYDGHVVDREILVQPVERRARTAAPADGYGCCRLEAEQLPCRVEEPVQNRAQGTVRAGVVGRRTDDETVRSGQFSVQRIVQFVPKDAAAELAAFVAGDAALHGFRADRDDLGRNSLLFERRSYLGERKKRIPLFTGTSVNE